jgi:hypothetical protein
MTRRSHSFYDEKESLLLRREGVTPSTTRRGAPYMQRLDGGVGDVTGARRGV